MHRYNSIDYVMNLDIEDGFELIKKAYEKDLEKKLWQQWLIDYSRMDKETFISFQDYKKKATKKTNNFGNNNKTDAKKAIEEAERIRKADQMQRGGVS